MSKQGNVSTEKEEAFYGTPSFSNLLFSDYLIEKRRKRRWGIFFKILFFILAVFIFMSIYTSSSGDKAEMLAQKEPHIGLVNLDGIIAANMSTSAEKINASLKQAFEDDLTKLVVLSINSPGGSPVQSGNIYDMIMSLRKEYPDKPIIAVCQDICASGGYYIASAATQIYASPMSLVGSIGVIAGGFGFVDAIKKLGIKRRLYYSGSNKAFLDPFTPQNEQQVADMQKMLNQLHNIFINAVKEGRGKAFKNKYAKIAFSGEPFSAEEGKKIGLIDHFGSIETVEADYKLTKIRHYTTESWLQRLLNKVSMEFNMMANAKTTTSVQLMSK